MPDLVAGTKILAADFPPGEFAFDGTGINDVSTTSYVPGTPVVDQTFVAPTSGRVLLIVSLGASDPGAGSDELVFLAPQVFEGTSASGTEIVAPHAQLRGVLSCNTAFLTALWSRATLLEGLKPETTYYARTMHLVSGGTTADISVRDITVVPVP